MSKKIDKIEIKNDNGELVMAQAPVIVSASRSTDIPAFYSKWFFERLEKGFLAWTNPFNQAKSYVSFAHTRFIVFWSKNPAPLLNYLPILKERNIGCYLQYSLNDYERDLERFTPPLDKRIDTFKRFVDVLGFGGVIWRFDPLILTDSISIDTLLERIERIGDALQGYTEKLVFSYADIESYRKVKINMNKASIQYREWQPEDMRVFAQKLVQLNKKWGYELATCAEKIDLEEFGIAHNKCIDDELIIKRAYQDKELMDFLDITINSALQPSLFDDTPQDAIELPNGSFAIKKGKKKSHKDKGQRDACDCITSKDIGEYNTCPHGCEYCYANTSVQHAKDKYKLHCSNNNAETITGQ